MNNADPRLSRLILAHAVPSATLNLVDSVRTRGLRRAIVLLVLGIGLPTVGELLATGPLKLLRHRTRPRIAGVPLGVLLGWYCVINGSFTVSERVLSRLPGEKRRAALPIGAALVGTSLDLVLDPCGLDVGLWEWRSDGVYAADVEGSNGRRGVPLVNYLGWIPLVSSVVYVYERCSGDGDQAIGSRVPGLLLLPYYLVAVAWAARERRFRYLLYSALFPAALYAALEKR